jgi:transcriptional regulator with XRE-family HTH domain
MTSDDASKFMTSYEKPVSRIQVRAARALLGWSQARLAEAARVGVTTIADYERGARTPIENNLAAIRMALEHAGVRFLEEELGGVLLLRANSPDLSLE